ncbi:MAG: hypothetical protein HQK65_12590, partial [Desulfamplus sp.]|nr:hypothetical protein [Desulfamplus sp.]
MKKKLNTILLTLPENLENPHDFSSLLPPIGHGILSSYMKKHGHNVRVIDAAALKLNRRAILNLLVHEKPDVLGLKIFTCSLNAAA